MKRLSAVICSLFLVCLLIPAVALAKPRLGFSIAVATNGFLSTTLAEVKVVTVRAGSPSERAGLKAGDLIVEMNGLTVKGASGPAMKKVLGGVKTGEHLVLKVKRGGDGLLVVDIVAGA